jgi:hypothetical protein
MPPLTTAGDRVVLLLAIALIAVLYAICWRDTETADRVQITVAGARPLTVPLSRDQVLELPGQLGTSRIEIRAGRIRFVDSPCRNKYCVHSGWLSHNGDFAACVPNGIALAVTGAGPRYDSINY